MAENEDQYREELERLPEAAPERVEQQERAPKEAEPTEPREAAPEEVKKEWERRAEELEVPAETQPRYRQHVQQTTGALDEEAKLKHLLDLARTHGPAYAIKVARESGDGYIVDTLHDQLSKGKLYEQYLEG